VKQHGGKTVLANKSLKLSTHHMIQHFKKRNKIALARAVWADKNRNVSKLDSLPVGIDRFKTLNGDFI
jgi:hypothetical protein